MVLAALDVRAVFNGKEQPNSITVIGEVLVYSSNGKVSVKKAESPPLNPAILLLEVTIEEGDGPMKGTPRKYGPYVERGDHVAGYDQVQVVSSRGDHATTTVFRLG